MKRIENCKKSKKILFRCGAFFCISVLLFLFSCTEADDEVAFRAENVEKKPVFTSFWLSCMSNPDLREDHVASVESDTLITLFCPELYVLDSVVPSFSTEGAVHVYVDGKEQISGTTPQDFNNTVHYEVVNRIGVRTSYAVQIKVLNGIPRVYIDTDGGVGVVSKTETVNATFRIKTEAGEMNTRGKIRGRGNATWTYLKKPYKIKFSDKQSPFGFPANKDRVLLAEYCDRSLLRTAYMCEVCKAVGMDFTIRYQYVDLFLNKEYLGVYLFTDFVEKAKERVNIGKDGYIIEQDWYWSEEPVSFSTEIKGFHYTFKYPDNLAVGNSSYEFIRDYMNRLEQSLLRLQDDASDTDFLNYIDVESFAKWFLVAEITATYDPNLYFVLPQQDGRLKMYPLWDAEWSLGLWPTLSCPPPNNLINNHIWEKKGYFSYLFRSPVFRNALKEVWEAGRWRVDGVAESIAEMQETISCACTENFARWTQTGQQLNVSFSCWEREAAYVNDFFAKRLEHIDRYVSDLEAN